MTAPLAGAGAAVVTAVALVMVAGAPPRRRAAPSSGHHGHPPAPPWVAEAARQAHWEGSLDSAWIAIRCIAGALTIAAAAAGGIVGVVLALAAAWAAPRAIRASLRRRRVTERDRQLPEAMERTAAALRAGALPTTAVAEVAAALPAPLGDELRRAVQRTGHGEPLASALQRWAIGPASSPAVVLAASALTLGAAAGGQVARAVDGVAATLRERQQIQAEVRALATQARTSAWLLATAPVAFAALVASIEPGVVRFLVATPLGWCCLLVGLGLDALGVAWMARIVRIPA